jgi:type IV secretory pathway VirB2 component (pilin)
MKWIPRKLDSSKHLPIIAATAVVAATLLFMPDLAHASLESSLDGIKYKLTGIILPTLSVIGIVFAALSFFTGNPNAKQHIMYAILGCVFGFGAQALVDFIQSTVR